jgi:Zn-dependent membrane protease YugP
LRPVSGLRCTGNVRWDRFDAPERNERAAMMLSYVALIGAMLLLPMGFAVILVGAFRRRIGVLLVGAACLGMGVLLYLGALRGEFGASDACLDSGGRWNYETRVCER